VVRDWDHKKADDSQRISRRRFVQLAAAGLLAGCSPSSDPAPTPPATETATQPPEPTATQAPTDVPAPAPPVRRPEIIRFHPEVPSKVVHAQHGGVWDEQTLVPEAIRQLLDASITELTGLADASRAWAALFAPDEQVAIKVNTIRGSQVWTHVPLVTAIAECLTEAGVPAEQIVVFDRDSTELVEAGFGINRREAGVRCYGTDADYAGWDGVDPAGWTLVGSGISLSNVLLNCDALINVPVCKVHTVTGVSLALKNHYGTFDRPWDYHDGEFMGRGLAELNALPPIKDRTRLIVGDALAASLLPRNLDPYWTVDAIGDSILMSFDPLAHDVVGRQVMAGMSEAIGRSFGWADRLSDPWLANAAAIGVGTDDLENIDLVGVNLR
jgi:uncharacterized protein (DUF362 family)